MKKIFALLIIAATCAALFTGCVGTPADTESTTDKATEQTDTEIQTET